MSAEAIRNQLIIHNEELHPEDNVARFLSLSSMVGFQVGATQFCLGILNAGILANMLSNSVLVGFMAAAALIIGTLLSYLILCLNKITIDYYTIHSNESDEDFVEYVNRGWAILQYAHGYYSEYQTNT